MKHVRSKVKLSSRSVTAEQVDTALRRFQTQLGVIMSLALLSLVALGTEVGRRSPEANVALLNANTISPWMGLTGIVALILLNAFLRCTQASVEAMKPMYVKATRDANPVMAEKLQYILDRRDTLVAALSLAGQLCVVFIILLCFLLAPLALTLFVERAGWGNDYGSLILTMFVLMVPVGFVNLIFGELIPKSFGAMHPQRVASIFSRPMKWIAFVMSPFAWLVTSTANLFATRFGGKASYVIDNIAEQEIRTIMETAESTGEIEQDEKELLHSVFEFTDTIAREVMTPRVDMDAMPVSSDPTEVIRVIQESGHSRIPIYEETDDQIVGIIHAKDLLMAMLNNRAPNLRTLMRPAFFVPENKNIHDLLEDFRRHRSQLAVVQDEFGGTAGIVTIEDIVEELVGDIVDEYDVEEPEVQRHENGWIVDGKAHVDDVNYRIGSEFSHDDFDTIGGYVFGLFGRQPKSDESISSDGFRFIVAESDGRRIVKLRIEKIEVDESELASAGPF